MSRKLKTVLWAAVLAALVLVALALLLPGRYQAPVMPNPNGYVLLVDAGKEASNKALEYRKMDDAALGQAVAANSNVLVRAREALRHESHVPWPSQKDMTTGLQDAQNHISDIGKLKVLALSFAAEAELAGRQGRWDQAVAGIGETLKLSLATARGGPLIDALVGLAVENAALVAAEGLIDKVPASQAAELARIFKAHDAARQTDVEVLENEARYVRAMYGIKAGPMKLLTRSALRKSEDSFRQRFKAQQQRTRYFIERAAARASAS